MAVAAFLAILTSDLVIGPGLVAELVGDVVAQRQDLLQQRDVLRAGQVVVLDEQLSCASPRVCALSITLR